MTKGCLLMLDLILSVGSIGSGSVPAATVSPAHARRISARPGAAQYVGGQVEVICNAFGYDASFSDFDLGHPGEPDPWRLASELKFLV